ncbi:protein cramped [Teleopsis dalmanni]|uniref:protein cramped n=1 Tax=Teleopsis dalmanni TaxID=139649 RepID=UPI0018CE39B9|nr:protein cramped [Teleopsis dalmanni]XP_037938636.1 protein cramped [Teleopsis dalmanni]XP_037938637.1 protein cramped [Teleopsis dalmanni]
MNANAFDEPQKQYPIFSDIVVSFDTNETKYEKQQSSDMCNYGLNIKKEKKMIVEEKIKTETETQINQLLGSVTTHNCPGTRTSARVIQKMKQDQSRPLTPPPNDIKKDDKAIQKTPSQIRPTKSSWTNFERDYFFDALNEYSKDFEAIANFINSKLKRKSSTESCKTKDQVRQHYYQTYHKICKYIKFSEEIKKPVQEMYALINYGEMRRKLQFVTDKNFMKLKILVYQGHVTVRSKGKNVRIKTPSCKALRKVNQLDDTLEDIRLPTKIDVIVTPAKMEAFSRVQSIAQNPRARITVPLHKKLFNFIKAFQYKWKSTELKLTENDTKLGQSLVDYEICFLPKPDVPIHRPLLSITEYLSSSNLSLSSYEDRIGVTVRSEELLNQDRVSNKRLRTDSNSEKRSPEVKKLKIDKSDLHNTEMTTSKDDINTFNQELEVLNIKSESSGDELSDEINELLTNTDIPNKSFSTTFENTKNEIYSPSTNVKSKRYTNAKNPRFALNYKPLINDGVIKRIRRGWTVSSAGDLTIGDLYVVLGQDSKLELDYYWTNVPCVNSKNNTTINEPAVSIQKEIAPFMQKINGIPYNPHECEDTNLLNTISTAHVNNKLKHLLLIANLSERIRKRQCSCGHFCDRNSIKARFERDIVAKTFISNKTYAANSEKGSKSIFRQPVVPARKPLNLHHAKFQNQQPTFKTSQHDTKNVSINLNKYQNGNHSLPNEKDSSHTNADFVEEETAGQEITITTTSNETSSSNISGVCNIQITVNNPIVQSENSCTNTFSYTESNQITNTETSRANNTTIKAPTYISNNIIFEDNATNIFNESFSPSHLLRESTSNSRWLEENLNDYSLTSLLGHLDEINSNRDILDPSSNISVISESSVDYRHKFQEIAALMQSQDKE